MVPCSRFVWHKDQKAVCHCLAAILNVADDSNKDDVLISQCWLNGLEKFSLSDRLGGNVQISTSECQVHLWICVYAHQYRDMHGLDLGIIYLSWFLQKQLLMQLPHGVSFKACTEGYRCTDQQSRQHSVAALCAGPVHWIVERRFVFDCPQPCAESWDMR